MQSTDLDIQPGTHVSEIETPSLLIDLDKMEANIQRMQARCNQLGLSFRPHIKTHKTPEIARMQLQAGAVGIACQKTSEAEVFASAGFNDIQLPYNVVGAKKTARLADLALYNRITVTVDHLNVIAGLAEAARHDDATIRVLIELATPIRRTGAQPHEVVQMAQRIEGEERLHFAGIMAYPSYAETRPIIQEALDYLNRVGIGVDIVSGGGTGAALAAHEIPELTELRVGTYIFNDWMTVLQGWTTPENCALTIATTVVSRPEEDRGILDAGSKTLSSDRLDGLFGHIVEYPEARIYQLNEEHGFVDFSTCDDRPQIGEIVHVIPMHVCVAVNLHDQLFGVRGDQVEFVWNVAARGKVW
jgi:D-serine deaminase-like pyridoxal phosphate-dependent protein